MSDNDQRRYYAERASIERMRAEKAADPASRTVHAEMAERYAFLAEGGKRLSGAAERPGPPRAETPQPQ